MTDDEFVPIAAINHYAYCPHRCWRMFCAGEFIDNVYTTEGTGHHQRVHTSGEGERSGVRQFRSIWLRSERLGLIGRSDLVEETAGQIYPVEYKRHVGSVEHNDALQLCAQALCLEEMTGRRVELGFLYCATTHRRLAVALNDALRQQTEHTVEQVRTLLLTAQCPPALYTPRCKGCSLEERCLPRLGQKLQRYREEE